ncbi:MAG TPA: DNA polymerase III subunit delta' [Candidatus Binatia bacterium]|nr:DNA polymerase III subunit delta' [Candidatus Binatia bacterium]
MSFSQIIGHEKQLQALRASVASGRLHHAYLFVGPEGVGKKTIALGLAKAIHCAQKTGDFCGCCIDCARIQDGNHPDVRVIEPQAGKKEISIQQVREIEKNLNLRSFSGGTKIAIVDPATLMNLPGQNALLKTLEEPPPNCLLILVAGNSGALLPTLRSRCLRLSFGPLRREVLADFLTARKAVNKEEADFLAALAMGSIGAAVKMDNEELRENRRAWIDWLASLRPGDYRAALGAADALASHRDEPLKFIEWAESWYRDLLIYTVTRDSRDLVNRDLMARLEDESARGTLEHMLFCIGETTQAGARIQRNLNRRMVLEELLFKIAAERR